MSIYGRIFARAYDRVCAGVEAAGLARRREALLAQARGRTLEIGAGTGANLEHYGAGVTELVLTEPEEPMAVRLDRHCARVGRPARVVRASAESLPFDDDSFDTAVATLCLCTVEDPDRALAELTRVLRPGGRLLFLEHVRSTDPTVARRQDRLNWIQRRIGHGCNCNRDTETLIERAGLHVDEIEHGEMYKAPAYLRPLIVGAASKP